MAGTRVYLDYVPKEEEERERPLGDDPETSALLFGWFLDFGMPCLVDPFQLPCPLKAAAAIASLNIEIEENVRYVQKLWMICASERAKAIQEDREEKDRRRNRKKK